MTCYRFLYRYMFLHQLRVAGPDKFLNVTSWAGMPVDIDLFVLMITFIKKILFENSESRVQHYSTPNIVFILFL